VDSSQITAGLASEYIKKLFITFEDFLQFGGCPAMSLRGTCRQAGKVVARQSRSKPGADSFASLGTSSAISIMSLLLKRLPHSLE